MTHFLTARYGYILVMMATVLVGIIALVRAIERSSESGNLIAAAISFGAGTLASRGR